MAKYKDSVLDFTIPASLKSLVLTHLQLKKEFRHKDSKKLLKLAIGAGKRIYHGALKLSINRLHADDLVDIIDSVLIFMSVEFRRTHGKAKYEYLESLLRLRRQLVLWDLNRTENANGERRNQE